MRAFKQSILALLFVFLFSPSFQGQDTFEDFKKQVNQDFNDFKQKTIQSFDDHVKQIDKEFADYLISNFGEHSLQQFDQKADGPKPVNAPIYSDSEEIISKQINAETKKPLSENSFVLPSLKKTDAIDFEKRDISFKYFGSGITISSDVNIIAESKKVNSAKGVAAYWTSLSQSNYNHLIDQFDTYRQTLNLNDWAYYLLIQSFSETVYTDDKDMKTLLTWYLLTRSGYKTRIAYDDSGVYLLLSSVYSMAGNYIRFDNVNYYLVEGSVDQLKTYEKDMPEADKVMDLSIGKPMNLANQNSDKSFHFKYHGENYKLKLSYNKNLIDFYATIPLSDIQLYFNSLPGLNTKFSIAEAFGPIIKDKSKSEAARILLSFVQQAFDYKTDQDAYGREKYMFADELLHYPYADCEDRSVLYAYLVKTLLNLDVVGLEFPGHMATAVHFSENPAGEYVSYNNKSFVIADPTFIGAPIGMLIPGVSKADAKIVLIKSDVKKRDKAKEIWDIVRKYGGYRSDVLQDVVFAPSGNAYVCGYFVKEANFGKNQLLSEYEGRDLFIAKFDPDLNPVWAKKATGPGNDMAYSLALDTKGILYVYGSCDKTLNFENEATIESGSLPDVFVARYAPNGDLRWVSRAGIDKVDHSVNFMFSASFNPAGDKIRAKLYNETKDFDYYGLNLDSNGNAVITGSFYATTGLNTTSIQSFNSVNDIPKVLKDTSDYFLNTLSYEKTIAGVFSALRLIQFDNFELSGTTIQKTLETYNESFLNNYKKFYDKLGKMTFVINKTGIVVIKTENKEAIDFKYLRITDNSRIKIITYENGNSKVDVLSGIKIIDESGDTSFDMNSISLSKEKGDLLFDFDDDHSKFKLNLRSQLLE